MVGERAQKDNYLLIDDGGGDDDGDDDHHGVSGGDKTCFDTPLPFSNACVI